MFKHVLDPQDQKEYARRRKRLMKAIGKRSAAIVPAASELIRNNDNHYPFRQSSDFFYLTGLNEPDALLVLCPKRAEGEVVLLLRPRDPMRERWDGPMVGLDDACRVYGADQAFDIDEADNVLPDLIGSYDRLTAPLADAELMMRVLGWLEGMRGRVRAGVTPPQTLKDLAGPLHDLRLIKSSIEIGRMRRAAQVSAEAHRTAALTVADGMYEYEVAAELVRVFARHHGEPSFASIVASGRNACVLHYRANASRLEGGDLVLIDAGAEIEHYAGDITRTWPVSGTFTKPQREIYQLVLDAQLAAIEAVQPGADFDAPHRAAVGVIVKGLIRLKLLKGPAQKVLEQGDYRRFFMHRTGHWLGMDVHDVGSYKQEGDWRALEPGMVLTVEPGLYIDDSEDVPVEYRGIGVRIEDDVLVTETGHDVLTAAVPKHVDEIEQFLNGGAPAPLDA
jgi:Xaa-Pro aminopeptidase